VKIDKDWRTIFRFAALCLVILTVIYICSLFIDYSKPTTAFDIVLGIVSLILCPPSQLGVLRIDCEVGTVAGIVMWCVIGLSNAVLYGVVGVLYVGLRKKRNESASI
jgi:hypothetical protein